MLVAPIVLFGIVAVGIFALFGVVVDRVLGIGENLDAREDQIPNSVTFEVIGRGKLHRKARIGKGSDILRKTLFIVRDAAFFCFFVLSTRGKREKKHCAKCDNEGGVEKYFFHTFLPILKVKMKKGGSVRQQSRSL